MSVHKLSEYEAILGDPLVQGFQSVQWGVNAAWPEMPQRSKPSSFPISALPIVGRDMVEAVAEAVQVPVDMAACVLLGAVSTCIVGRGKVLVRPGYEEPLHAYFVVAADPSERKSACLTAMLSPVHEYIKQQNEALRPQIKDNQAKIGMMRKQLVKAENKGDEIEVLNISRKIEELELVRPFELIIAEGTTEGLTMVMARNGGRIAVVSAEGGLFDILAGAYAANGVNIDVILQGYSGEPISSVRVTRETERIDRACLSITLAVQPIAIEKLLANDSMVNRGVIGRFLISAPTSLLGTRKARNTRPIPEAVKAKYADRLHGILRQGDVCLKLSSDAYQLFVENAESIEARLVPEGDLRRLPSGWGGKISGNTARIAGLLALLEGEAESISGHAMQAAVTIAEYFMSQMIFISGADMQTSPEASEVLRYIEQWGCTIFGPYKLRQALRCRKRFEKGGTVDRALSELVALGYIRKTLPPEWGGTGRKPEAMFEVHPDLIKKEGQVMIEI